MSGGLTGIKLFDDAPNYKGQEHRNAFPFEIVSTDMQLVMNWHLLQLHPPARSVR